VWPTSSRNGEGGICVPLRARLVLGAGTPNRLVFAFVGASCQDGAGPLETASFTGLAQFTVGRGTGRYAGAGGTGLASFTEDARRTTGLPSSAASPAERLRAAVATLGMPRQPVVRDRLPGRRGADELADTGTDPGVIVEGAHADPDRVRVARVAAEERRAAVSTEPLLAAALRLPDAQPILAADDPKGARGRMGVG
jgi:hypothetical protein